MTYMFRLVPVLKKINEMTLDLSKTYSYVAIINYWNINVEKEYQFFCDTHQRHNMIEFIKHLVSISLQFIKARRARDSYRRFYEELHILAETIISSNTDLTDIANIMKSYDNDVNNILLEYQESNLYTLNVKIFLLILSKIFLILILFKICVQSIIDGYVKKYNNTEM